MNPATVSPVKPHTSYGVSEPILRPKYHAWRLPRRSDGPKRHGVDRDEGGREGANGSPFIRTDQVNIATESFPRDEVGYFPNLFHPPPLKQQG
ncbi:hypothetical protein [Nitrosovibrio sp. Nv4]|uniref:hypothetical protein n=1 Tax=Nitrosovibrio sp. Nv4 TaxID=1945880 RepID=UPI0011809F2B|nr:hypothetical protein [Nitrosovibrio sp. Nv4]